MVQASKSKLDSTNVSIYKITAQTKESAMTFKLTDSYGYS